MTVQVASRDAAARQTTVAEANKGYMSGFGNGFETEALAGRTSGRPQFSAEMSLRALRRAA